MMRSLTPGPLGQLYHLPPSRIQYISLSRRMVQLLVTPSCPKKQFVSNGASSRC